MKFLIYGSNGWIGNQICSYLTQQNYTYYTSNIRVDNTVELEDEIYTIKPTHIISTIGRTHGVYNNEEYQTIDYLEQSGKLVENIRDNLYGPTTLAIISQKYDIHLTYLGTGCIFNYDDKHPLGNPDTGYMEYDNPNFMGSSYSVVKGFTDRLMKLFFNNVLNVRIRMPIVDGKNKRDFISKILKYQKICDMPNSMSVLPTLIPIMIDMAVKHRVGTINLTNPGLISHNEILQMYKEIVDPSFKWENFSIDEQDKILASKRSNNCLNTSKLLESYPEIPDIKTAIKNVINQMIKTE